MFYFSLISCHWNIKPYLQAEISNLKVDTPKLTLEIRESFEDSFYRIPYILGGQITQKES